MFVTIGPFEDMPDIPLTNHQTVESIDVVMANNKNDHGARDVHIVLAQDSVDTQNATIRFTKIKTTGLSADNIGDQTVIDGVNLQAATFVEMTRNNNVMDGVLITVTDVVGGPTTNVKYSLYKVALNSNFLHINQSLPITTLDIYNTWTVINTETPRKSPSIARKSVV